MSKITVNGKSYSLPEKGNLLDFLRNNGFLGAKGACRTGHCGSCTVLVNKIPQKACVTPLKNLNNSEIITIESVKEISELNVIARCFVDEFAIQCGFCIPGMILRAYGLYLNYFEKEWTQSLISEYFDENICRCTGYASIIRAVQKVKRILLGEEELSLSAENIRPDVWKKALGTALFSEDYFMEKMLSVAIVRSTEPYAEILNIDFTKAWIDGVADIITSQDIPGKLYQGIIVKDQPVLADKVVRYYGEPIVAIAAETLEIARKAVKLVEITYKKFQPVISPESALQSKGIHSNFPDNILKSYVLEHGDIEKTVSKSSVVIEKEFSTQFIEHAYLEPECAVAIPEKNKKIRVITGVQNVYHSREAVAEVLGEPLENIRCSLAFIGGAFGGKEDIVCDAIAALFCRRTGRPVKYVLSRKESLMTSVKRHPFKIKSRISLDKKGLIQSLEMDILGDTGAYASIGDVVVLRALTQSTGPYYIPVFKLSSKAVYTNNVPTGAMRGFGVPQVCFAVETLLSLASEKLKIDEFEIRRINGVKQDSILAIGQKLSEGTAFIETLDRTQELLLEKIDDYRKNFPEQEFFWGIASGFKNTGLGNASPVDYSEIKLELSREGKWIVGCGASECGQGIMGVLRQILYEVTGSPIENIEILAADTDLTPDSGVTSASRQTFMSGNSLLECVGKMLEKLSNQAEKISSSNGGWFYTENGISNLSGDHFSLAEIVEKSGKKRIQVKTRYTPPLTVIVTNKNFEINQPVHNTFSYITQAVISRKNPVTNLPEIVEIISVQDVGRVIHTELARGQVEGGILMGLGFTLKENFIIENAIPKTLTFGNLNLPRFSDCPKLSIEFIENLDPETPLGSKGIGELTLIPTAPAILSSFWRAGLERVYDLPLRK